MFGTKLSRCAVRSVARLEREKYERGSAYVKAPHNFDTHGRRRYLTRRRPSARPLRTPRVALDQSTLTNILLTIPVLLFALVAHEWAHAYAALKQGDPTAYELGRLTFNPIKHIDPFMTIILPIVMLAGSHGAIALGGAKPCPVNPSNFRNYKRGDIIVSLAGVTMNLLLAIASAVLFLVAGVIGHALPDGAASVLGIVQQMLKISVLYNSLLLVLQPAPDPAARRLARHRALSSAGARVRVQAHRAASDCSFSSGCSTSAAACMSVLLIARRLSSYQALMHPVLPLRARPAVTAMLTPLDSRHRAVRRRARALLRPARSAAHAHSRRAGRHLRHPDRAHLRAVPAAHPHARTRRSRRVSRDGRAAAAHQGADAAAAPRRRRRVGRSARGARAPAARVPADARSRRRAASIAATSGATASRAATCRSPPRRRSRRSRCRSPSCSPPSTACFASRTSRPCTKSSRARSTSTARSTRFARCSRIAGTRGGRDIVVADAEPWQVLSALLGAARARAAAASCALVQLRPFANVEITA